MKFQVSSSTVKIEKWFDTRDLAIRAFERQCKREGITPPLHYPPRVSGDGVQHSSRVYPRWMRATGARDGHGYVFVESRNDTEEK